MTGPGKVAPVWGHSDGAAVRLWNFDIGKHKLKPEHSIGLARWVLPVLRAGGSARVVGLTSRTGSAAYNKALSQRRAAEVVSELQRQLGPAGIARRTAIAVGLGETTAAVVGDPDGRENSTWRAVTIFYYRRPDPPPPPQKVPPLPPLPDFGLEGEFAHIVHMIYKGTEIVETATTIAEIAHLLSEGSLFVMGVSVFNLIVTPLFLIVEFKNAFETGDQIDRCIAVAYATTAWAFYDDVPQPSPEIVRRKQDPHNIYDFEGDPAKRILHFRALWEETVRKTQAALDDEARKMREKEESRVCKPVNYLRALKAIYRGAADNDRQTLMEKIMKELEGKLRPGTPRRVLHGLWNGEGKLKYPN